MFVSAIHPQGTITSTAPESQLQHLQSLQEQLAKQTERISKPQEQPTPPIDSGLLAQIQVLTSQLLNKTNSTGPDSAPDVKSAAPIKEAVDVSKNVLDAHVNRQLPFDIPRPPPNSVEPVFKAEPIFNKVLVYLQSYIQHTHTHTVSPLFDNLCLNFLLVCLCECYTSSAFVMLRYSQFDSW